ncbi:AMP-binding protein [Halegenticoccus tardaugens]|uniref:AMP-binding protein n=1 Tax=Halegenticoccus tardaugens TaxID=2071624 RepID=UPI00100B1E03|nr:AMP-binding protein [Halegenticoccus tardaugens]
METLCDLVARDRRSERPALRIPGVSRAYSYHDVCTTAWKAGNALRYLGVGRGRRVELDDDPFVAPVVTFFGALLLGAETSFVPGEGEARAVVVRRSREAEFDDLPPGRKLVVYGGPPSSPTVAHWERDVWSENPSFPPVAVAPTDPALVTDGRAYAHADLLAAARRVVDRFGLDADGDVAVRAPLRRPGTVAAGLVAPLLAGGTIVFPDPDAGGERVCDLGVGTDCPDAAEIAPDAVELD